MDNPGRYEFGHFSQARMQRSAPAATLRQSHRTLPGPRLFQPMLTKIIRRQRGSRESVDDVLNPGPQFCRRLDLSQPPASMAVAAPSKQFPTYCGNCIPPADIHSDRDIHCGWSPWNWRPSEFRPQHGWLGGGIRGRLCSTLKARR